MNKVARAQAQTTKNGVNDRMDGLDRINEPVRSETEKLLLKKQIEDDIRQQLANFADEIARAKKQRETH